MFTKKFWQDAITRAVRTAAEAALGVIGTTATFGAVDWKIVGGTVLLSTITAILLAIATGLPESKEQ